MGKQGKVDWAAPKLAGMVFAFTGRLENKQPIEQWIVQEGGTKAPALTDKTTHLVVGNKAKRPTADESKAAKLNAKGASIAVITEAGFWGLIAPSREDAIAMLTAGDPGLARWRMYRTQSWWLNALIPMPDLSGADLRGVRYSGTELNFSGVGLDGADFRGARLSWVDGIKARGARFDDAFMEHSKGLELVECSLKRADLNTSYIWQNGHLERCDFSEADLREAAFFSTDCSGSIFRKAKLHKRLFKNCKFAGADFSGADLTQADLKDSDLSGVKFVGADLTGAMLTGVKLRDADLRKAKLCNANLAGADLTGAEIAGADFTGANVYDAKLPASVEKVKGLKAALNPSIGKPGDAIRQIAAWATNAESLSAGVRLEFPDRPSVSLHIGAHAGKPYGVSEESSPTGWGGEQHRCRATTIEDLYLELAGQWSGGTIIPDSAEASVKKGPIRAKELLPVTLAAWYEAFGKPQPDTDARQAEAAKAREEFLALLRQGEKGVEEWNSDGGRLTRAGDFKGADFSGLSLKSFNFFGLDYESADFSKCDLTHCKFGREQPNLTRARFTRAVMQRAFLSSADLSGCDLSGADLSDAHLNATKFTGANLCWANLSRAWLSAANLCGADLSGADVANARLDGAKFDEHTRFPKGFSIPAGMKWVGKGPRPGARTVSGQVDFNGLVIGIKEHLDAGKFDKAAKMLKADRFRLFAEVADDGLSGVVKSQTDKDLVYSCRLGADGKFGCCTQNLKICGGLQGSLCKHLLVLVVGLAKQGQLEPSRALAWLQAALNHKPELDKARMSDTLLRFKGAEAGEVDWRPVETVPEDYYSL